SFCHTSPDFLYHAARARRTRSVPVKKFFEKFFSKRLTDLQMRDSIKSVPCIASNQGRAPMGTDAQLNKGVLEGCVLKLLEGDFLFSAEIVERMRGRGFSDFSEGTLYPMLL